jgi:hypothetical protein
VREQKLTINEYTARAAQIGKLIPILGKRNLSVYWRGQKIIKNELITAIAANFHNSFPKRNAPGRCGENCSMKASAHIVFTEQ